MVRPFSTSPSIQGVEANPVPVSRSTRSFFASILIVGGLLLGPATLPTTAATGDVGIEGLSYAGAGSSPTGEKPESKAWFNDGIWWASLWDTSSGRYEIFRLNGQTWASTNIPLDPRSNSRADTLWTGSKLYVASHVFSESPASGYPSNLYRFSYNASTDTYTLDAGWPQQINDVRSETLVIDIDSTGQLWATWVQNDASGVRRVHVNRTTSADSTWGTPFVLPGSSTLTRVSSDDISSLIAFGGDSIGVLWSNQRTAPKQFIFMMHDDSAADGTWHPTVAIQGGARFGDDHINLKTLLADGAGRVYAAVKTSNTDGTEASLVLLSRGTTGTWTSQTMWTVADKMTRPLVLLDTTNNRIHAFASRESGGSVYTKSSPMGSLNFASGTGTVVMHDASASDINNVTSTKQNVSAGTGLLVLASNDSTNRYWHYFDPLTGVPPPTGPTASFTASPTSGQAPLGVTFTDTSTGSPTSWSWDFTDDGIVDSTAQHPSFTYTAAGGYTARLTVSNSFGSSSTTRSITVTSPGGGGGTTLTPTDDTYVDAGNPTAVNGSVNNLRVRSGSVTLHTYLKFTVAGVGAVTDARLRLWVTDASVDGGSLYAVPSTTWTEGTTNWNTRPQTSGGAIDTVGAAPLGQWVELDVSGVVSGDGTYSFALINASNDVARYSSSEATAAQRPQLVLTPAP